MANLRKLLFPAAILLAGCQVSPRAVTPLRPRSVEVEEERRAFDQPDRALEYYAKRRLAPGSTVLAPERYRAAVEQARRLRRFDSATGQFLAAEGKERDRAALGSWTQLGPSNVGGRSRAIRIHPTQPDTMYAASAAGGVWKSTNGGGQWNPTGDLLPNMVVNALAMDPAAPDTLYAGTGEGYGNFDALAGAGIFKTTDGAASWTALPSTVNNQDFVFVNNIVVSSTNSQRLYASTNTGVMRSLDGGASWSRVLTTNRFPGCLDLAIRTDTQNDTVLVACGQGGRQPGSIFRNTDAGGSGAWVEVLTDTRMGRSSLAFAPTNQNIVYAAASCGNAQLCGDFKNGLFAIFRSDSGGAAGSWNVQTDNRSSNTLNRLIFTNPAVATCQDTPDFSNQGWYDNVIAVDPLDPNIVWAGGIDLFRSNDAGKTWALTSYWWASPANGQYAHADHHAIAFHPQYNGTGNQTLFVGNDGGIFRTTNARGTTTTSVCRVAGDANRILWTPVNNGFAATQFYGGAVFPDGATYFAGTQDNGTVLGTDGGGVAGWRSINGGDGGYVAVDPTNTNILYSENTDLSIQKSTDGGKTFSKASTGISDPPGNFPFITIFVMDPTNPQRLYLGGKSLWRTDNAAGLWSQASRAITSPQGFGFIASIAVAPSNANHVLVGSDEGFIHRLDNAVASNAQTAFKSVAQPRTGTVSALAFDPRNDSVAFAAYSNFNAPGSEGHIFRSNDGGTTWTRADVSSPNALPDIPVSALAIDPGNSSRLYAGTDIGVFVSDDGGVNWVRENTDFANVPVDSFVINSNGNNARLYAFSHGRGVWRVPLGTFCSFTLTGPQSFTGAGGTGTVAIATASGCAWEAKSDSDWVTFTGATTGTGNGNVAFRVAANPSTDPRTARITVGSQVFVITQAGAGCTFLVAPLRLTAPAAGGTSTVGVTVGTATCSWTAFSNVGWITITNGSSGTGNGTVTLSFAPNPLTSTRTGTVTVAEQTVTVTQAPRPAGSGPAFDEFSGATVINTFPFATRVDTTLATSNPSDPIHTCTKQRDSNTVWFKFTPTFTGNLQITTVGSNYDTVLAVYTGTLTVDREVACNDDATQFIQQSTVNLAVSANVGYIIEVSGYGDSSPGGTLVLTLSANDQVATATPIAALPFTITQDTRLATSVDSDPQHSCTNGSKDSKTVWFSYRAGFTGRLMLDTIGSSYDTVLTVYQGNGVPQRDIACNDDIQVGTDLYLLQSSLGVDVTSGQNYLIEVSGWSTNSPGGSLTLNAQGNDLPASASVVTQLPFVIKQSTYSATKTPDEPAQTCAAKGSSHTVWYRYTPTSTGRIQVSTAGSTFLGAPFDTVVSAHSGQGTLLACNDDVSDSDPTSLLSFPVTSGVPVLIQVGAAGANSVGGDLRLIVREDQPCTFVLGPTTTTVRAIGGSGTVRLTAGPGCSWAAASDSAWIAITSARNGVGSALIDFTVAANPSPDPRTGTITAGGQTLTINQESGLAALADLVVTEVNAPTTAVAGGDFNVSAVVRNQGLGAAGRFFLGYFFSTTNVIGPDAIDTGWGCDIRQGLGPNGFIRCTGGIHVPADIAPGDYYFGAVADTNFEVLESDKSNNSLAAGNPTTISKAVTGTIKVRILPRN